MEFELIKHTDLGQSHFTKSLTWAQYYEPDDVEALVELGFDKNDVSAALEKKGWSDEYWFAVPEQTEIGSFMYEYRKAVFTTGSGKKLDGYVVNSGHCICLFGADKEWTININLLDLLEEKLAELKVDVGLDENESLLPLEASISFKNVSFIFGESG